MLFTVLIPLLYCSRSWSPTAKGGHRKFQWVGVMNDLTYPAPLHTTRQTGRPLPTRTWENWKWYSQLTSQGNSTWNSRLQTGALTRLPALNGLEAPQRADKLSTKGFKRDSNEGESDPGTSVCPFTATHKISQMTPSIQIQVFQTQDREDNWTCYPREMQPGADLGGVDHLPILQAEEETWEVSERTQPPP